MSTPIVTTVLEIENEAQKVLADARREAEKIVADARIRRDDAARESAEEVKRIIAEHEAKAADERARKVKELTASGNAALSAVRNISDAAFEGGVQHVMKALTGE